MKKLFAIVLALSLLALCACASQDAKPSTETAAESSAGETTTETAAETETATDQSETDAAAEDGADVADASEEDGVHRVAPIDDQPDVSQLTDAMVAASFDENGIEEKEGKTYLTFSVYDYDRYDMVDVAQLAEGDIFVAGGKDLSVKSKTEENGLVLINGGLEQGGVTLTSDDNGVYYELGVDDVKCYRSIGTVTMELSADCTVTDSSDAEHPDKAAQVSQLAELAKDGTGFIAANTTITIADGKVVSIARSYLP